MLWIMWIDDRRDVIKWFVIRKSNKSFYKIFSSWRDVDFLRRTNLNLRIHIKNRKTKKNFFDFWNFIWSLMGMCSVQCAVCTGNVASSPRLNVWNMWQHHSLSIVRFSIVYRNRNIKFPSYCLISFAFFFSSLSNLYITHFFIAEFAIGNNNKRSNAKEKKQKYFYKWCKLKSSCRQVWIYQASNVEKCLPNEWILINI